MVTFINVHYIIIRKITKYLKNKIFRANQILYYYIRVIMQLSTQLKTWV